MTRILRNGVTRRLFLGGALATTSVLRANGANNAMGAISDKWFANELDNKFYADGRPRFFPGCTIISHIRADSLLHQTLNSIIDMAYGEPVMKKFSLLPKSSLHMTLMNGIDDEHRNFPLWPKSVPVTASLQSCREWCAERLQNFRTLRSGDFQMVQDFDTLQPRLCGFTIWLKPLDNAQNAIMRDIRNRLSTTLEIREPNHDMYAFHITLGYLIVPLNPNEEIAFAAFYRKVRERLLKEIPVLSIGRPEFCTFSDMFAFDTKFYLLD